MRRTITPTHPLMQPLQSGVGQKRGRIHPKNRGGNQKWRKKMPGAHPMYCYSLTEVLSSKNPPGFGIRMVGGCSDGFPLFKIKWS